MSSRTPLVSFIGIGAQKCGTTWIHRNLALHPQLSVAHGQDKDTRFFSCFYDRGYEWYEACFDTATADVHTGEVSTSYFHTADAPQRIKAYNPDAKLFVCLRNPVERVLSNHRHEARVGHISGANLALEAALENNPAIESYRWNARDRELTLVVKDDVGLRELLIDLGAGLDILGVHSEKLSLHDIFVQAVAANKRDPSEGIP